MSNTAVGIVQHTGQHPQQQRCHSCHRGAHVFLNSVDRAVMQLRSQYQLSCRLAPLSRQLVPDSSCCLASCLLYAAAFSWSGSIAAGLTADDLAGLRYVGLGLSEQLAASPFPSVQSVHLSLTDGKVCGQL